MEAILNRLVLKTKKKVSRYFRKPQPYEVITGNPPELQHEMLASLCLEHLDSPLKEVSYVHLSGWKNQGAFRVYIKAINGKVWSLIYKNSKYNLLEIPALNGFPASPGYSEFLIYSDTQSNISKYLPIVYLCVEREPGKHYQFLMEDLSGIYTQASSIPRKKFRPLIVSELPAFHKEMKKWSQKNLNEKLPKYNSQFAYLLIQYARKIITRVAQTTNNIAAANVLSRFSLIENQFLDKKYFHNRDLSLIHGDMNIANVLVHKNLKGNIKLIDWEWAGIGHPLSDLVSLYRTAKAETYKPVLECYYENKLSRNYHCSIAIYEWCRLERGLINASFMAAQHMGSKNFEDRNPVKWLPFTEAYLNVVLDAHNALLNSDSTGSKI